MTMGRDHPHGDAGAHPARALQPGAALRFRGSGLVLALRRRGVDRAVRIRLRDLGSSQKPKAGRSCPV
ncbi:hypothetical protein BHX98_19695 [Acinetobacter baumannii]|nr:hypothetical protein BHX98_19695 [Acinetobacter baumannii]